MYPFLAYVFFLTLLIFIFLGFGLLFKPEVWQTNRVKIMIFCCLWFIPYLTFILFFTGPEDLSIYPPKQFSPYKLPWKNPITRFVAQGNRSFTSHRGNNLYAWDFVMLNETEILAARDGKVVEVLDDHEGIGWVSNFIAIEHDDATRGIYAHIRQKGSLVRVGDIIKQGQPVALSGMVGQTIFPHLHFYVTSKDSSQPIPISFNDVPDSGVPLAGHFYTSGNVGH